MISPDESSASCRSRPAQQRVSAVSTHSTSFGEEICSCELWLGVILTMICRLHNVSTLSRFLRPLTKRQRGLVCVQSGRLSYGRITISSFISLYSIMLVLLVIGDVSSSCVGI